MNTHQSEEEKKWQAIRNSAEYLNVWDTENLLKLLMTGLDGEIHSVYPTINTLKCQIRDDGKNLLYSSHSILQTISDPPPVVYQNEAYGLLKKFYIQTEHIPFVVPEGLTHTGINFGSDVMTGIFDKLKSIVEDKPCFLRSIHSVESGIANAAGVFQTLPFRAKEIYRGAGLLHFNVFEVPYALFDFELNGTRYLIIDAKDKVLKQDFDAMVSALIVVYAFITGYYINDRSFLIYSLKPDFTNINCFDYHKGEGSKTTGFTVLAPREVKEVILNLEGDQHLPPVIFSNLIESALQNEDTLRVFKILAESLDHPESVRGAVYSVVLETIKDQLIKKGGAKFNPIKDKSTKETIITSFSKIIDELPDDAFNNKKAILKKIEQINQIGNLDGFYKLFEDRGIELNEHDRETIKHRNNFLHGRLPEDTSKKMNSKEYLTSVTLKMHLLISAILLTDAGYRGYYINYFKYRLKHASDEPIFRKMA